MVPKISTNFFQILIKFFFPVFDNFKGVLTPTESSDDEGETVYKTCNNSSVGNPVVFANSAGNPGSTNIDKRKIAQALQSLIDNKTKPRTSNGVVTTTAATATPHDTIKFKFRMKFKSSSPQRRAPAKTPKHKPIAKEPKYSAKTSKNVTPVKYVQPGNLPRSKSGSSSCSTSSISGSNEKNREIRDLHNSMERQRRVDLRLNFEQVS